MNRDGVDWRGYWPAAPTPFNRDGSLDLVAWKELLRLYIDQGVHGILVNGSTGEWFAQTDAERMRVAQAAVDEVGGAVPLVVGCTALVPSDTCRLASHAHAVGADGVLSTPPPYAVPTNREVLAFYRQICDAAVGPVMVYNWPRGTNVEICGKLTTELAALDNVVAFKDSTADKLRASGNLEAVVGDVRYFGSFINRLGLRLLRVVGGDGNIDGGGLGAPFGIAFYQAYWAGDLAAARAEADRYTSLMGQLIRPDWSAVYGSPPAQLKAAMRILGQPGGYPRRPLLDVDAPEALSNLRSILSGAGLVS